MSNIRLGTGRGFRYVYSQKLPSVVRAFGPGNNPRSRVCRGMFDPSLSRESHRRDGMGHLKSTELPESLVHPAGYDREPRRSGGRAWVWILGVVVVLGFTYWYFHSARGGAAVAALGGAAGGHGGGPGEFNPDQIVPVVVSTATR